MRAALPFEAMAAHGDGPDTGLLWAINRYIFHPRGYALAIHFETCDRCNGDREVTENETIVSCPKCNGVGAGERAFGWSIMGKGRELFSFDEALDEEGFRLFEAFLDTLPSEEESNVEAT